MTHTLQVPYWAKDVKDDGMLCFIAFQTHVNRTYGPDWYNYASSDVNTMLGLSLSQHQKWMENRFPQLVPYIQWAQPLNGETMVKMDGRLSGAAPQGYYEYVEIHDERVIRVWCYLLGCMNRHLLSEQSPSKKPPFLAGTYAYQYDHQLFKYSHGE